MGCRGAPPTTLTAAGYAVSVPYSSGLGLSGSARPARFRPRCPFQSPIHRGLGCRGHRQALQPGLGLRVSVPYSSGLGLSGLLRRADHAYRDRFQSPIHRGLGCRALPATRAETRARRFSPLFIGAWVVGYFHDWLEGRCKSRRFSPLFTGAWVVGGTITVRPSSNDRRFSPLFIGAWVVGPGSSPGAGRGSPRFSPLFIGAWVVGATSAGDGFASYRFSPLFIGAWVVGSVKDRAGVGVQHGFQSPIHRGLGCRVRPITASSRLALFVSVPYSSGLGLSGEVRTSVLPDLTLGFSPLFIGAWVVGEGAAKRTSKAIEVSVPYSSGLGLSGCFPDLMIRTGKDSFSPLFIGAWVVGENRVRRVNRGQRRFSPLFIGAWVVGAKPAAESPPLFGFQSPIHRGLGCRERRRVVWLNREFVSVPYSSGLGLSGAVGRSPGGLPSTVSVPYSSGLGLSGWVPDRIIQAVLDSFSPLFIGAWVVGGEDFLAQSPDGQFQSPIHRGLGCRAATPGHRSS